MPNIDYILCDVEGTTTSKDFVFKVLFPFSYERLPSFLQQHPEHQVPGITTNDLLQWIKEDIKHPVLKTIQGLIWEEGYKNKTLKGHVYDDVEPAFKRWCQLGKKLGIYSSGSVLAQKLIFGNSTSGDLTKYLSHYFDTAVGNKKEVVSYQNIAKQLGIMPEKILFLSDIEAELTAAQNAGFQVTLINRDQSPTSQNFKMQKDFNFF